MLPTFKNKVVKGVKAVQFQKSPLLHEIAFLIVPNSGPLHDETCSLFADCKAVRVPPMFPQEKPSNPRQTIVPIAASFEVFSSILVCEFSSIILSLKAGCQLFLVSTSNCTNPCALCDGDFKPLLQYMLGDVNTCVEHSNVVFNFLIHASKEVQQVASALYVQEVPYHQHLVMHFITLHNQI